MQIKRSDIIYMMQQAIKDYTRKRYLPNDIAAATQIANGIYEVYMIKLKDGKRVTALNDILRNTKREKYNDAITRAIKSQKQ